MTIEQANAYFASLPEGFAPARQLQEALSAKAGRVDYLGVAGTAGKTTAADRGIKVIIAAAGKAAHLGGVVAAFTPLPVIGVPMKTSDLGGMDSLLSMVQMPSGVPVACVAINGAKNAAIYATQILGACDPEYRKVIEKMKQEMADA